MPCAISFPDPLTTWNIFAQMLQENTTWITDENLAEHSATPEETTLEKLGLVVHGELVGTRRILCFCRPLLKQFTIDDINRYRLVHLVQDCGPDVLGKVYEGTPVDGLTHMLEIKKSISAAASRKQIKDSDRMGAGVWKVEDVASTPSAGEQNTTSCAAHTRLLLVGSHQLATYNGGWEKSTDPTAGRKIIDFGGCEQWYEFDTLGQYLADAHDPQWRRDTFDDLQAVFQRWDNWEHGQNDALLAAALAVVTWLQTTWDFRPLVFVTGATNTGKTTLLHDWFEGFYGNLAFVVDKPSEAGFRQIIENTAMVAAIDELEKLGKQERDNLQKTLRTSTRRGRVAKGTSNQKGQLFGMQHIVWCGAIETGLTEAADRNRYIVLSLKEVQRYAGRPTFHLPSPEDLQDLGQRCLALAMVTQQDVAQMAESLKDAPLLRTVDRRVQEAYALPAAMIAVIGGMDVQQASGCLESLLQGRHEELQTVRDEESLMAEIMGATVRMAHGVESTVSRLLDDQSDTPTDTVQALSTHGIAQIGSYGALGRRVFLVPSIVCRKLLRGTRFQDLKIDELLMRIPGAERTQHRMGANRPRGICIPRSTVIEFGSSREQGDAADGMSEGGGAVVPVGDF